MEKQFSAKNSWKSVKIISALHNFLKRIKDESQVTQCWKKYWLFIFPKFFSHRNRLFQIVTFSFGQKEWDYLGKSLTVSVTIWVYYEWGQYIKCSRFEGPDLNRTLLVVFGLRCQRVKISSLWLICDESGSSSLTDESGVRSLTDESIRIKPSRVSQGFRLHNHHH